ncbi:peptidylprolyl isomerase [Hydromonas duriensis]|uniref:SurA-like protein n=1 Tax=Hydromonas duriensis TaxID=1527608 RepID=A0A4R6YA20_9BURK|nr:peptidylprolyl isomerase [Hydromonas duriensis]TDR32345.1 SurA-like protein [Hydromonas duriensis]
MFDFVHKHKKIIQLILAVLFVPFMFSGVSNLSSDATAADVVAKVGQQDITAAMFERRYQQYIDAKRVALGDAFDQSAFDTPDQRILFLNEMVNQFAISEAVKAGHLTVGDAQVLAALLKDPNIKRDAQGNVDRAAYESLLKNNNLTEAQYESTVRASLAEGLLRQMATSGFSLTPLQKSTLTELLTRVRVVEMKSVDLTPYMDKVKVDATQVEQYYKAHTAQFTKTESFDVDYAVIPVLPANYVPTDDDIKAAFGGTPSAEDIDKVRKDSALLKEVVSKVAASKMEGVAKLIDEASGKAPQDLAAIASRFGGTVETFKNLSREGGAHLPDALKSNEVRLALITGPQVAAQAISSPVKANGTSLIVGRVTKQTQAGLLPLADVLAEIEKTLKQEAVLALARDEAKKQIAGMNASQSIGPKMMVGPLLNNVLSSKTVGQVLAVASKDLPQLLVSEESNSVSILRVVGEQSADTAADKSNALPSSLQQWSDLSGVLQQRAYLQQLRERLGVKLYPERLGSLDKSKV